MRIYINGRFLTQTVSGVQRYAIELVQSLDQLLNQKDLLKKYEFVLISPKGVQTKLELHNIQLKITSFLKGHLWEQFFLPFYTQGNLLINLCNTGPILKRKQIVTIHDAAVYSFPKAYSLIFRIWYQVLYKVLGKVALKIITVSNFSKNQLQEYCGINPGKIKVIHEGYEHILCKSPNSQILSRFSIRPKFILAVSSLNPNKNFGSIVKAIDLLGEVDFDVVIAGGVNPKVFHTISNSSPSYVKYVGYVSDEELRTLYDNAACFIFPSFYEGFGLPPLEAMACGCPVIVSNRASMPEICADAAIYCEPNDPADIANKINYVMSNSLVQEQLRGKGKERIKRFSWINTARELLAGIKEVL